jgi:ribosomal protein L29
MKIQQEKLTEKNQQEELKEKPNEGKKEYFGIDVSLEW